jgi:hypothetical protein
VEYEWQHLALKMTSLRRNRSEDRHIEGAIDSCYVALPQDTHFIGRRKNCGVNIHDYQMHTYQMTVDFDVRHFRYTLESLCFLKHKCTYVLLGRGSGGRCSVFDDDKDLYKREGWGHIPKAPHPLRVGDVFLVGTSEFVVKTMRTETEEEMKIFNEQMKKRLTILRNVPWMQALPPSQLNTIADMLQLKRYWKGDLVYQQGEEADSMYIVAEGSVELFYFSAPGCEVVTAALTNIYDEMLGSQKTDKDQVKELFRLQGIAYNSIRDAQNGDSFGGRAVTSDKVCMCVRVSRPLSQVFSAFHSCAVSLVYYVSILHVVNN